METIFWFLYFVCTQQGMSLSMSKPMFTHFGFYYITSYLFSSISQTLFSGFFAASSVSTQTPNVGVAQVLSFTPSPS